MMGTWKPANIKKTLLTPEEKSAILESMRQEPTKNARFWSTAFRRLPETILKIAAEAERIAAQLRGQGVALFREEVAKGMGQAAEQMKQANLDINVILFSMWTEAIKNFAEYGKGNVIFLDGSSEGMEKTMRQIMAMQQMGPK
jgi:regulator of protease activity HflC (stomatin/prohibitin superfamily)